MEHSGVKEFTLESVRESLIRQEDTIIFSLIERAKFAFNSSLYGESSIEIPGFYGSLIHYIVKEIERIEAKVRNIGSCLCRSQQYLVLMRKLEIQYEIPLFYLLNCFYFFLCWRNLEE